MCRFGVGMCRFRYPHFGFSIQDSSFWLPFFGSRFKIPVFGSHFGGSDSGFRFLGRIFRIPIQDSAGWLPGSGAGWLAGRQADGQAGGQADRQVRRQADGQAGKQAGRQVHNVYSFGFYFLVSVAEYLAEEWMEARAFTELCVHTLYTPPFM